MPKTTPQKIKNPHLPFTLKMIQWMFSSLGSIFPQFFGNLAYNFWFTAQRYKTPAKELPAKNAAIRSVMNTHGLPVSVYQWGNTNAPKVLFAHGWSGRGTQCALFIEPLLSAGFQVISFDGPAHGDTPGKQTSVLQFSDVIIELNKQYGPFDAAFTHSFGGMLLAYAMTLDTNISTSIKHITCLCPPDSFETIFKGFQRTLNLPNKVMQVVDDKFYATHGHWIRSAISTVTTVKSLSIKALIIHDADDTEIPLACGRKVADAWPNAALLTTQGLGHRRIMRDAEVIKATVEFFSQ